MTDPNPRPPRDPIKVHGAAISGHCHRVELFCSLLGPGFLPMVQTPQPLVG